MNTRRRARNCRFRLTLAAIGSGSRGDRLGETIWRDHGWTHLVWRLKYDIFLQEQLVFFFEFIPSRMNQWVWRWVWRGCLRRCPNWRSSSFDRKLAWSLMPTVVGTRGIYLNQFHILRSLKNYLNHLKLPVYLNWVTNWSSMHSFWGIVASIQNRILKKTKISVAFSYPRIGNIKISKEFIATA